MFSATVPSKSSISWGRYPTCGPSSTRSQPSIGIPSSNTSPRTLPQMPSKTLASVDLPEPLGPSTTSTVPAVSTRSTPLRMGVERPGAVAITPLKLILPRGGIRFNAGSRSGTGWAFKRALKRLKASVALIEMRQVATSKSIGASARDMRTLDAIIAPGLSSPSITNIAPAPSASDCWVYRMNLLIALSRWVRSAANEP